MFLLKDCSSSEEYSVAAALLPLTTAFYRVSSVTSLKSAPVFYVFMYIVVKWKEVKMRGA